LTTISDHADPIAGNLLDRQLTAAAPNQRWVGDTMEFVIGDSQKLHLAAVLGRAHASWWAGRSAPSMIAGSR
jgi:transposase InsO family protein